MTTVRVELTQDAERVAAGVVGTVVEDTTDRDRGGDFTGWFCVAREPATCGCGWPVRFVEVSFAREEGHRIVVWPDQDDPAMLRLAKERKRDGDNPKIVEYEHGMGVCVSFYRLGSLGIDL